MLYFYTLYCGVGHGYNFTSITVYVILCCSIDIKYIVITGLQLHFISPFVSLLYHLHYSSHLHFYSPSTWQAVHIFAFQLNGEPPSLPRFHNPIKKRKKKIPSCVRRDPCLLYRKQCQPFCPGMRGRERKK